MTDVSVELKVDRSLLDPHFDGYKLSLDSLPTYRVSLNNGVDEVKLTDAQYSYQHVKAFGIHNHLFQDPWNPDTVYFVDNAWVVYSLTVRVETSFKPMRVFTIPDAANQKLGPGRHNATLAFPSPTLVVLADGAGRLYIIETGNRVDSPKWKVSLSETVLGEGKPFTLLYSNIQSDNEIHRLNCLLLHVDPAEPVSNGASSSQNEDGTDAHSTSFVTVLEWLTYASAVDHLSWTLERTRRLTGTRSPDYAALQPGGRSILVAADRPFKMVYDSLKPVEIMKKKEKAEEDRAPPAYTWLQNAEEVGVQFTLPAGTGKADIAFQLSTDHLELGIKNGETLLSGELHAPVDVEGSAWTIQGMTLDLTLAKREPTTWPLVVCGDTRGEMVIDENEAKIIHERLAHLTSEAPGADPEEMRKPVYNAQQLEECDVFPDESSTMIRVDGESHNVTHQVHLGSNQWLFNMRCTPDAAPAVCFRHDVDGLVWQPAPEDEAKPRQNPWIHCATFNALGYVQASKQNKKFTGCASDFSYAFIADCMRHIYIYRQPAPTLSPLRNRKTGREVGAIAKQQVISLDTTEDIYGVVATPERLFLIVGKTLFVIRVKQEAVPI